MCAFCHHAKKRLTYAVTCLRHLPVQVRLTKGLGLSEPLINMALGPKQFGRWAEGCEILVENHVDFLKGCLGNGDLPQRLFLRFYQILSSVSNSLRSIYKLIKVPIN